MRRMALLFLIVSEESTFLEGGLVRVLLPLTSYKVQTALLIYLAVAEYQTDFILSRDLPRMWPLGHQVWVQISILLLFACDLG